MNDSSLTSAQLYRAVVGAHTNLCGGASTEGAKARRHFRIALSEAGEAGGCLDLAFDLGALDRADYDAIRAIRLSHVISCHTK